MKLLAAIKKIADKSQERFRHGAIVLKGGAILSSGYNHGSIHAERMAMAKLWPNKVKGTTIISIRTTRKGFGRSRPCRNCWTRMRELRVKDTWYFDGEEFVRERI